MVWILDSFDIIFQPAVDEPVRWNLFLLDTLLPRCLLQLARAAMESAKDGTITLQQASAI